MDDIGAPSAYPGVHVPAQVVTYHEADACRTRTVVLPVTYTLPRVSTATSSGRSSWACRAGPSRVPWTPFPAIVRTAPDNVEIVRTRRLPWSAT